jgi:hypothetical protein
MPHQVHLALVGGQWHKIDESDSSFYLLTRCLTRREDDEEESAQAQVRSFRERRYQSQNRQGSPLRHEYDPEANITFRCFDVDGKRRWVEGDWSEEPLRKLWGFGSDHGDEGSPDATEMEPTAKSVERGTQRSGQGGLIEQGPAELPEVGINEVVPKHSRLTWVYFGEVTVHEFSTETDEEQWMVRFGEEDVLDQEESEDRAKYLRFGRLASIESSKETKLRRKLLSPVSKHHNCDRCLDREELINDGAEEEVFPGHTAVNEIREDFVTTIDEPERSENFITTVEEQEPEEGHDILHPIEQPARAKDASRTDNESTNTSRLRKKTIKFAAVTVVKESPANHLPTLKSFPDFCTASKPIFRPDSNRHKASPMVCRESVVSSQRYDQASFQHNHYNLEIQ